MVADLVVRPPCASLAAKPGRESGTAEAGEHALLARAKADAARRNAAVFVDPTTVPQPADVARVREIAGAIRSWSAGEPCVVPSNTRANTESVSS